jgi:hypothetical protein
MLLDEKERQSTLRKNTDLQFSKEKKKELLELWGGPYGNK